MPDEQKMSFFLNGIREEDEKFSTATNLVLVYTRVTYNGLLKSGSVRTNESKMANKVLWWK
jgi:hypothetical protein